MAGPVRIEAELWDEWRVEALCASCGHVNIYETVGRLAKLWSIATDRETYYLPEAAIRIYLGAKGVDGLLESDLGERVDGGIRLKGSRRFDALWAYCEKQRAKGRAGGEESARKRSASKFAIGTTEVPTGGADAYVSEHTNVQAGAKPESSREQADVKPEQAAGNLLSSGSGSSQRKNKEPEGDSLAKVAIRKRQIARADLGRLHSERYDAVRSAIGSDARSLNLGGDGERWLSECILSRGDVGVDEAIGDCRRAIANRERQAMSLGSVKYFGPGMWASAEFTRAIGWSSKDLAEMGQPRPQPRPVAAGEPVSYAPRKIGPRQ